MIQNIDTQTFHDFLGTFFTNFNANPDLDIEFVDYTGIKKDTEAGYYSLEAESPASVVDRLIRASRNNKAMMYLLPYQDSTCLAKPTYTAIVLDPVSPDVTNADCKAVGIQIFVLRGEPGMDELEDGQTDGGEHYSLVESFYGFVAQEKGRTVARLEAVAAQIHVIDADVVRSNVANFSALSDEDPEIRLWVPLAPGMVSARASSVRDNDDKWSGEVGPSPAAPILDPIGAPLDVAPLYDYADPTEEHVRVWSETFFKSLTRLAVAFGDLRPQS